MRKVPLILTLVVTENCNLDCSYCFVVNKSTRKMPPEIALSKVEKYLNSTSPRYDHVQIDFTGGEPLLNFPLIKTVVEHVARGIWKKKHSFFIATNATLITPEIRDWSAIHPCVTFAFSLDGTRDAHNTNRSGSYDRVVRNVDFFKRWTDNKVKMTIGPSSVAQVADGVKNAHSLGLGITANVVFEDVWGEDEESLLEEFEKQLSELVDYYLGHPGLEPPYLVNMPIEELLFPKAKHEKFCGSGKNMVAVDVNGVEYPCHRFLPMSSTRPCAKPDTRFRGIKPKTCDNCVLLPLCPSCNAYNYEVNGDINHRTTYHCRFMQLQALASAKLKYLRLVKETVEHPPESCDNLQGAKIKRTADALRLLASRLQAPAAT